MAARCLIQSRVPRKRPRRSRRLQGHRHRRRDRGRDRRRRRSSRMGDRPVPTLRRGRGILGRPRRPRWRAQAQRRSRARSAPPSKPNGGWPANRRRRVRKGLRPRARRRSRRKRPGSCDLARDRRADRRRRSQSGATRVIVGVGGSATTDGGLGALEAIDEAGGIGDADVLVACDVTVGFVDAARIFGPQKGRARSRSSCSSERLAELLATYRRRGVDLDGLPGSGAAGGLAGGLVVAGARIVPGFDLVAGLVGLDIAGSPPRDLVLTGEGGSTRPPGRERSWPASPARAAAADRSVIVIAGQVAPDALRPEGRRHWSICRQSVCRCRGPVGCRSVPNRLRRCCEVAATALLSP